MWQRLLKKREARRDAIAKAREGFVSFRLVSESPGWKFYESAIEKDINNIKNQMENKTDLTGDDLKMLQLALKVYRKVQRIPLDLKTNAKANIKGGN